MPPPVETPSTGTSNAEARARAGSPTLPDSLTNLPNVLTLLRIATIPLLVWLLSYPDARTSVATFIVFALASLTDFFDGWIARRYGLVTALGKLLDPLADKLLVVTALVMLALMDRSPGIPGWLLVLIVGRELAVTGLRSIAAAEGIVLAADGLGKLKTVLQIIAVHALILHYTYYGLSFYGLGMITLVGSALVGAWSAVVYHVDVFREIRAR